MAKPNQMAALDEDFKVGRLESKIKDYEIDLAELQREVTRLQSEANSSSKAFDGTIDSNLLVPSRWQPRTNFDPVEMQELEDSILAAGEVITPVLLLRDTNELIDGERRTRVACKLNMVVKYRRLDVSDDVAADYVTLVNIKRTDLNPIDETNSVLDTIARKLNLDNREAAATLIRQIKNELGGQVSKNNVILKETAQTIESCIKQFTKGSLSLTSFASNRLKLLNIPEEIKLAIANGEVDYTKGTEIAKVKDDRARAKLLERTIEEDLSIREVKKAAALVKPPKKSQSDSLGNAADLQYNDSSKANLELNPHLPTIDTANELVTHSEEDLNVTIEEKSELILHRIRNESLPLANKQELNSLLDRVIALLNQPDGSSQRSNSVQEGKLDGTQL
jgi:ParB family transcriptional regulator, chromosome partitioning protein